MCWKEKRLINSIYYILYYEKMKSDIIRFVNKNKKIFVKINSFLDRSNFLKNREEFINIVLKDLKKQKENNIAGFLNKKSLHDQLKREIFDNKQSLFFNYKVYHKIKIEKIKILIREIIEDIDYLLDSRKISIYIFPTLSNFVIKKMNGVSGFLVWKNTIHIYLYPLKGWGKNFKSAFLHELAHCIQPYYSYKMNLFEHLIAEGLAEHFQKYYLKKINPWTKTINKKKAKEIFKRLNKKLDKIMEKNYSLHTGLFFGNKKYPLWTGYSISFYLVDDLLKKEKNIDWKKLLKTNPNLFKKDKRIKKWFD